MSESRMPGMCRIQKVALISTFFVFVAKILVFVAISKYAAGMLITTYIKGDLSARLKSGRELPAQLTIGALAEHYNVSYTPVRSAMAELIDEGLLKKGPNRRL